MIVMLVLLGCVSPKVSMRLDALEGTVAAQQAQLDALNATLADRPAAPPTPTRSDEAAELVRQAKEAAAAGDANRAKALIADAKARYPGDASLRSVERLENELAVYGSRLQPSGYEWIQGAESLDAGLTYLVFFEAWCPHCRREMPKVQEALPEWTAGGVRVIGLTKQSKGVDDAALRAFLDESAVSFAVAREDGALSQQLAISGIPAAALLKDGVMIWRGHPAQFTPAKVAEAVALSSR